MLTTVRTTMTIDDDVLAAARRRAAEAGLPLVEVVNRALRRGLAEDGPLRVAAPTVVYGAAVPDPGLADRLAAADDDDLRRQAGL
ncbi:MAG: hypothetical protein RLZZ127_3031 [Planctomycetota bacterium]